MAFRESLADARRAVRGSLVFGREALRGFEQAVEVTCAQPNRLPQTFERDRFFALFDQPAGFGDQRRMLSILRGAVRIASLAGAEACSLRRQQVIVESYVLRICGARWTGRAAVDAGSLDRVPERAVDGSIARGNLGPTRIVLRGGAFFDLRAARCRCHDDSPIRSSSVTMVLRRLPNTPASAFKFAILGRLGKSLIMPDLLRIMAASSSRPNAGSVGAIWRQASAH